VFFFLGASKLSDKFSYEHAISVDFMWKIRIK